MNQACRTCAVAAVVTLVTTGGAGAQDSTTGKASFYSKRQPVACKGLGPFDPDKMTAAHRSIPCGSKVEVTEPKSGKRVIVTITDRGPNKRTGRDLDLSRAAAREFGMMKRGVFTVSYRVVPNVRLPTVPTFVERFRGCIWIPQILPC